MKKSKLLLRERLKQKSVLNTYLQCQDCNQRKPDVSETTCPYAEEINNTIVNIVVCDDCCRSRAWDI